MGIRTFLLLFALIGCTSSVMAQTSSLDTDTPAVPARYTLISFVDNGDMTVATVPAVVSIAAPATSPSGNATSSNTNAVAEEIDLDGGDGISDAPDAGWESRKSKVRIN